MSTWISIQYLRAFAALAVVWIHACLQLEKVAGIDASGWFNGRSGVDLFFVVSGFIIWVTTFESRQGALIFWYRRLIRILPLYWLCTLGMVGLLVALPGLFEREHLSVGHVLLSLLFVPHADPFIADETYPLLQVGWTLNYEMFFYALFGLCLLLRPAHRVVAACLLLGGLVTAGTFLDADHPLAATYFNPLLLEFLAGVVIGYMFTSRWQPDRSVGYGFILLAVLAFVALAEGPRVDTVQWRALCWGLPAILLVIGAATVERASGMPRIAWLHRLGDASYAIYLSHPFTLGGVGWLWGKWTMMPSVFLGLAMIASIVLGLLFHLCVEQPLIKLLKTRWTRRPRISPIERGRLFVRRWQQREVVV